MAFHVNWWPSTQDAITEIWMTAEDRGDVSRSNDAIDRQLRCDPLGFGEQRTGNLRIAFHGPLAVMFAVYPDDLRVDVVGIKRIKSTDSSP